VLVRISAKTDYAMRAVLELAAADTPPIKRDEIAQAQEIPVKFLETILGELKHAGIVSSQRGADGGYWLAKPAEEITVADVMRVVEGRLASVRETSPEDLDYSGSAESLRDVWVALRANMRDVLEHVTLADIAAGDLPKPVEKLAADPEAWVTH
jgi:Rrf2 family protein